MEVFSAVIEQPLSNNIFLPNAVMTKYTNIHVRPVVMASVSHS